ncbi:Rid family detoxifying hydrolase [Escherichia coli]|uniref:Rid family detoxifying hydrolase n=1 Tax=Escherichia TaxID=561 RepID=UPI00050AC160|nr:Rid family detoxifying hydrolase [Escherichia coli]ASX09254.1 reactive intermediate/imine deaminase [Escherichia coli]EFM4651750.1 RidA family protein [Escherichia coli]MBW8515881.1 Rid family detoxifying hydrolase [Escherichia coli]MCX9781685.1 Rid family detoxifying hydrolase [Escherichia coli]MDT1389511.1 Rid family detoxifying hydrolase [Escherichia coli]
MTKKDIIYTTGAPAPGGALSQAVKAGETIYLAGQVGFDPHTMQVVSTDFDEQARQAFKNLLSVAEAAGGSDRDIVKLNAYLTDVNMFPRFNAIMSEYFSPPYPARATLGIAALPQGAVIEIEAIMVL